MKRSFKIKSSVLLYFSSFFLTLLFNEGHADPKVDNTFSYRNVEIWLSKKMKRPKTSLKRIRTRVFFWNVGCMHWVTYLIFQDLKIIEEFDLMGPSPSGRILKGLYQWLFLEYKIIGIHLDSSEWRLYPTRCTTPSRRNGIDYRAFSILYALRLGLRLKITNISQQRMPRTHCQMLIHLLKISEADDNNVVVVVGPGGEGKEANANNPVHLLDKSDDDGDKEPAHIDGMSDDNGGDDDGNIEDDGMSNNADDEEETGNAGQENDNNEAGDAGQENKNNEAPAKTMLATTRMLMGGQDNDQADDNDNAGKGGDQEDNDGGTDADSKRDTDNEKKTLTKMTMQTKTMKMSTLYSKK
jgi:hypothetical protein